MTRCLITGASGFVGSYLTEYLKNLGWQPRCLVRASSNTSRLESLGAELATGSLETGEGLSAAVANRDVVFHVAGRTTAIRPQEFAQTNQEGTRRIAEACASVPKPPTLVLVSSLAAGGPATLDQPRTESDADAPVSDYGKSKLAGELAAASFAGQVPTSIVRPPIVFGPGDHAGLSIYNSIRWCRIHPRPGLRQFPVSLVYVEDLCEAMVQIAQRGQRIAPSTNGSPKTKSGTYYVSAERAVPYAEFGKLAGTSAGWTTVTAPVPRPAFWVAGALGEALGRVRRRACVLNFDKVREALSRGWVCSDAKLRSELGYQQAAPLEQRFAQTVAWYREHGWLP